MYVLHKTNKLVKIHEVSEKKNGGGEEDFRQTEVSRQLQTYFLSHRQHF